MRKITQLLIATTAAGIGIVGLSTPASACHAGQICDADIASETSNFTSDAGGDDAADSPIRDTDLAKETSNLTSEPDDAAGSMNEYEIGGLGITSEPDTTTGSMNEFAIGANS